MAMDAKNNLWINRIGALVIGGALVFIVGSTGVVSTLKGENVALQAQLTEIKNGAPRLMSEAVAFAGQKDYANALKTLDSLFALQPGSAEAAEGKKLYDTVEATVKRNESKWDAAVGAIRADWERTTAKDLRIQMEKDMLNTLGQQWEQSKAAIRKDWEDKQI